MGLLYNRKSLVPTSQNSASNDCFQQSKFYTNIKIYSLHENLTTVWMWSRSHSAVELLNHFFWIDIEDTFSRKNSKRSTFLNAQRLFALRKLNDRMSNVVDCRISRFLLKTSFLHQRAPFLSKRRQPDHMRYRINFVEICFPKLP